MAIAAQKVLKASNWTTVKIQWVSGVGTFVFGTDKNLGVGKGFDFSGITDPIVVTLAPGQELYTWTDAPGGIANISIEDLPVLRHKASAP